MTRQKLTLAAAWLIIGSGLWFWWEQIQDVLELLALAYG